VSPLEPPIYLIGWPRRPLVRDGGPAPGFPPDPLQPRAAHPVQGRAARYGKPFALQLPPDFASAVDLADIPAGIVVPLPPGR
jgi:hypothetical protein